MWGGRNGKQFAGLENNLRDELQLHILEKLSFNKTTNFSSCTDKKKSARRLCCEKILFIMNLSKTRRSNEIQNEAAYSTEKKNLVL